MGFEKRVLRAGLAALLLLCCAFASPAGRPAIDPNAIVFVWLQSDSVIPSIRWNSITHVAGTFITFNASGNLASNISTRNAALKAGGAAQQAGVKYIMCVNSFDTTANGAIVTVMTDYTAAGPKQNLINQIKNQITADGYCAGVNFDIEFTWGATVRDGIADFLTKMRAALPSNYEISVYVNAMYSSSQWNAPNLATNCNYIQFSGYDWATGNTAHAITDHNSNETHINNWIAAGIPAEKFIYTISTYGRKWTGIAAYNGVGSSPSSMGFTDGLYDTTLRTSAGGPYTNQYFSGDEAAYYAYNVSGTNYTVTWDNEESLEYKIRSTLSFTAGTNAGRRLRGVGYWSLMWLAETGSYDPLGSASGTGSNYLRTYPHVYQLTEEILSPPGNKRMVFQKFESLDPRWDGFSNADAANKPSPDNRNVNGATTVRSVVNAATGVGQPPDTSKAMQLVFNFSNTPGKLFFRHELLNSNIDTAVPDKHAAAAKFGKNTAINAYVWVGASGYAGNTLRLVVMDNNRQLEASPAYSLSSGGWRLLTWDLSNSVAGNVTGLTTAEPAFVTGNGTLDVGTDTARGLGFVGFLLERSASGAATGTLQFDELSYEPRTPAGQYKINEFRYNDAASEFVEISGPSGSFPAGMTMRFYNSADGTILSSVALSGRTIPFTGLFVVGDTGVPNVGYTPTGWGTGDNIPNTAPSAIQLIDTSNDCVYDSVSYKAMGGLKGLLRRQTRGVTSEGYGWLGDTGTGKMGTNAITFGRYPDGADTQINENDFSLIPPSPGDPNGGNIPAQGVAYSFDSLPASAFQTYQAITVGPPATGIPASPSGGNVARIVDTTGGGVQAYFGDPALGYSGVCKVTGELYIPPATEPAQAMAVGICGRQGSTFFASTTASSGYDSGYWLIYERGAVGLNDGQANHDGAFQFIWARNDNMWPNGSTALGTNMTLANVGIAALPTNGKWVPFELVIDRTLPNYQTQLYAVVNGVDVYRGPIPTGGPYSGAFQVGFREANSGTVTAKMGTWIDNLKINVVEQRNQTVDWELYR